MSRTFVEGLMCRVFAMVFACGVGIGAYAGDRAIGRT